jgi:organic hydroperoxide reductase OsmC/OhrA
MSIYIAVATRTGVRQGEVGGSPEVPALVFSAPPEFKGQQGVWTPEHFFTASVATCFITTFEAIAEFSKFAFDGLAVAAEGLLGKADGGFRFTRVIVKPTLTVSREEDRERGLRLLEKAERGCLISRSLSTEITLQPTILVRTSS